MSGAIVAKAINDTIGTSDFEGLNSIFDRQLTQFNTYINNFNSTLKDTLDDYVDAIKVQHAKGLIPSDKMYWVFSASRTVPEEYYTTNAVTVNYDGAVKIKVAAAIGAYAQILLTVIINGGEYQSIAVQNPSTDNIAQQLNGETIIKVNQGDEISVKFKRASMSATGSASEVSASLEHVSLCAEICDFSGISIN